MSGRRSAMPGAWTDFVDGSLQRLQDVALLRRLHPLQPSLDPMQAGVTVEDDVLRAWVSEHASAPAPGAAAEAGQQMHSLRMFATNDYLGLSTHARVRQAAADAAMAHGSGPRSSALVGGYTRQHAELEAALARLKGKEAALLFPTGFAANAGTIAALAGGGGCHVFSDALNHASIIDGARLAVRGGARLHVFRHSDMRHLEELLLKVPRSERKLVVTDSLFSMDGDWAKLRGLAHLRRRHGFLLALDDAHASLVVGPSGSGAAGAAGLTDQVDIIIGTLSKGFGAHGGFVACDAPLQRLLLSAARTYMFSTALPLPLVAAAHAALEVSQKEPWRREHLRRLWMLLGKRLGVTPQSPIVPLIVGSEADTLAAASRLLQAGFYVPAIRPPTVPAGTSRLRISLSSAHSTEDVEALAAAIRGCGVVLPGQSQTSNSSPSLQPADGPELGDAPDGDIDAEAVSAQPASADVQQRLRSRL